MNEGDWNKEKKDAIGQFVDSFEVALQVDVLQQRPGEDQQDSASAILVHIMELSRRDFLEVDGKPRMSDFEAFRFWKPIFDRALPSGEVAAFDKIEKLDSREYPLLPLNSTGLTIQERLEWNPDEFKPPEIKAREIPTTLLDYRVAARTRVGYGSLQVPKVLTLSVQPPGIWSWEKLSKIRWETSAVKEGTMLSALLFQASKMRGKSSILLSAFPSEQDARYPPVFLDQEFLESTNAGEALVRQVIFQSRCRLPSNLLQNVVNNALSVISDQSMNPTERSACEKTAYGLLKLLSQSDRPQLAHHDILRTIIDRPDSSSWHRRLLTKNFLRRLPMTQAQEFIRCFESSIRSKLDQQNTLCANRHKVTILQPQPASNSPPKPLIKLTIIKFFAQLLNDADAIFIKNSVQMLSDLLQKSTHVDVRVAVVESLLSKLSTCEDESVLEEQVLQALEELIPIMGGADECEQLNEKDWQQAEKTGNLPEVSDDGGVHAVPPILGTMYSTFRDGRFGELSDSVRRS